MKVTGHQYGVYPGMGRVMKTAYSALPEFESRQEIRKQCQMNTNGVTMLKVNIV